MCTPIARRGCRRARRLQSTRAGLVFPVALGIALLLNACSQEIPVEPDPSKEAPRAQADVTAAQVPSNDAIEDATVIGSLPFTDNTNTAEATTAPEDPECVGNGHTVWYRFTPTANLNVNANTFGSDYDTSLSVYTGSPGDLTQIACNDDAGQGVQSSVTFQAVAGETYFIMVGSYFDSPGGDLTVTVQEAPPPLETDLTIARAGTVTPRTGQAIVRGTVTCSRPALVDISGQLRQRAGRVFITADFFAFVECDGETAWEAEAIPQNGLLAGGRAEVQVGALFFDSLTQDVSFSEAEATVRLRGRRR